MDVVSENSVNRMIAAYGTTRRYELEDKTWVSAEDGTVSQRNKNPERSHLLRSSVSG